MIKKVLLSVSDKTNIIDLAQVLANEFFCEIYASAGSVKALQEAGIKVFPVSTITGNPECFDGRMKTISFEMGAALLYRRDHIVDCETAAQLEIPKIDLVICNLYPFEKVSQTHPYDQAQLIENIDIGGPLMLRAAAKNFTHVASLVDPQDYPAFIEQLRLQNGDLTLEYRKHLALKVWGHIAHYDQVIYEQLQRLWTQRPEDPQQGMGSQEIRLEALPLELRYGENPHQEAKLFNVKNEQGFGFAQAQILQGKALSYNNFLDADQAFKMVSEAKFIWPNKSAVSIIKHGNPCGFCVSPDRERSFLQAWNSDPISRFGAVLAFSDTVTRSVAETLAGQFIEIIIAPDFSTEAKQILSNKSNLRLLQMPLKNHKSKELTYRSIYGALLVQNEDEVLSLNYSLVTQRDFPNEVKALLPFGELCSKYLKSNAIALVGYSQLGDWILVGAGAGQPNRIDSFKQLAWPRFQEQNQISLEHCLMASDAFFPFRDMIDFAAQKGIQFIIQPGGSLRDAEVIQACDQNAIAMAFSGQRHFRH